MRIFLVLGLVFNFSFNARAQVPSPAPLSYELLSQSRSKMVFPKYTAEEKERIAKQALYFLKNYFVHLELKVKAFQIDPLAALSQIQEQAVSMDDQSLHLALQKAFLSVRDLHTNYNFPKPMACYRSVLPFSLEKIEIEKGKIAVAVSALTESSEVRALSPGFEMIKLGDRLESMSGESALKRIEALEEAGAGANPSARFRRAMQALTFRSHKRMLPPEANTEQLEFVRADGSRYQVELNWVAQANPACLAPAPTPVSSRLEKQVSGQVNELLEYQRFYQKASKSSKKDGLITTKEPGIHYQLSQASVGSFAYLKLDDFEPNSEADALNIVTNLLEVTFKDTLGLIIDLRNNGGGQIGYGEKLEQLFTAHAIRTTKFRMLANRANRDYLSVSDPSSQNISLIDQAIASGLAYTSPLHLTTVASANLRGQSYLKPVAILTDSGCYSTCDMFTAGMQDHGIAKVWATDGNTGAGGANVVAYSAFQKEFPKDRPNPFLQLPGSQDMRVSWRQSLRVKKNEGRILENEGVIADQTLATQQEDLSTGSALLMTTIAKDLYASYQTSLVKNIAVELGTKDRQDFKSGEALTYGLKVSGTTSVVIASQGKRLSTTTLSSEPSDIRLSLAPEIAQSLPMVGALELVGYVDGGTGNAKRAWRKIVQYRKVPALHASLPGELSFTQGMPAPFQIYNQGASGWQTQKGVLRISAGPDYEDNVYSEAALFLDFTQASAARLKFTAELHSEQDYDFFKVLAVVDGKETALLPPSSGDIASKDYDYDLSFLHGKKAEIRLASTRN